MNIVILANSSWYLSNFRSSTIVALNGLADVVCMYPFGAGGAEESNRFSCSIERFYLVASSRNPFKELLALISIFHKLLKTRPDLVFSFNPKTNLYTLIACWFLRIPCVPNVSGAGMASQLSGVTGRLYHSLVRFFYRRAFHVFFQNTDDMKSFVESGFVDERRAEVLPGSGVDLDRFHPVSHRKGTLRFLMAARLIAPKGVGEYLEAARRVIKSGGNCEFLLAGVEDDSFRAVSKSLIAGLKEEKKIHFLGHVEDMPKLLDTVDCVVLPSYYPEGVPRSLIEAAASGKVIITTHTPGCREVVVSGKNGYLVEPKSVDQLFEAMCKVLLLPLDELRAMQFTSRKIAEERFDEKIVIRRYLEVAGEIQCRAI